MAAHAQGLWEETMNGDAMKAAHAASSTGEAMKGTHDIGDSIKSVMDLLAKMP
jgi:hypothetical protein